MINSSSDEDRLPPHAEEAEWGVISCVFQDPSGCLDEARLMIRDGYEFYDVRVRTVWLAMLALDEARMAIDVITVKRHLEDNGLLEEVGGLAMLQRLPDRAPSTQNLPAYLRIVREKHWLRRWLTFCIESRERVLGCGNDVDGLAGDLSAKMFALCETVQRCSEKTMREVMIGVHDEVLSKFRRGVKFRVGPMTGFNYLDNILPGLGKGQLIVLAARPRTGKSAWIMQVAEHIAERERVPVLVLSLEMTGTSLGSRALFQRAGADITKFMNGFMTDADVQKLTVAAEQLGKLGLFIDDAAELSIEDVEVRCRRLVRKHKLGVIFIDYFQLLFSRNKQRTWNTNDELGYCSKRLKALAKELQVPIVLCAQMNREIEKETHRRPRLSDLRDTGQLEQDADVVMFLWKPDVSSEQWEKKIGDILPRIPCPEEWKAGKSWKKNLAVVTCTVEKQREGRSGEDATLVFIKPWTRFVDAYRPTGTLSDAGTLGQDEPEERELGDARPETRPEEQVMPSNEELGIG